MQTRQRQLNVPIGVIVAREDIENIWQDHVWRPLEVFLDAPKIEGWRELRRGDGFIHYHAATLDLELHAKETAGYLENLESREPSLYVVVRRDDLGDDDAMPVEVHLVTASVHEVEAYGEDGTEEITPVPMPEPVFDLLAAFVEEYHRDEPFIKRKRKKYHREEEHKFGQEPVDELRRRMKGDK